jgi:C4-dicarboxylate transporter DctQ subunit
MLPMLSRCIDLFEKYVITLAFAVATLLLFTNVVLRYVFDLGLSWVLETVQYLFAWVVLVGAAHGVKLGIHLGIDILIIKLSPHYRKVAVVTAAMLCIAFIAVVDYYSVIYIVKIHDWGDRTQDLHIPQWIPYLAIPVGLSLMLYHFLFIAWQLITGQRETIHTSELPKAIEELEQ